MDDQCSPFGWEFYYQEKGLDDLRHCLFYTTLELEATVVSAKEEIARRECDLIQLNDLLSKIIKERDEAQEKSQKLMLEKLLLQQELQQKQQLEQGKQKLLQQYYEQHQQDTASQKEDELHGGICNKHSVSSCEENNIASPAKNPTPQSPSLQVALELAEKKPLPEKGKLLQAVIEAGPLLQTLLLAGPLPQWQHPPPQLNSIEIPPVAVSSPCLPSPDSCMKPCINKKRDQVPCEGTDSTSCSKYQKVTLH
ncbi:Enabled-like protein (DUF1635) [Quillaja saponaria]|uniref:Enabled-like protein (DUF1635) n=1 Tax=Quillaja saponaria TaxID=32244 RepID=A0AAD7M653_QUISA|nr:Enabled-like protein (DUF1635) [Quillaja saponaria]